MQQGDDFQKNEPDSSPAATDASNRSFNSVCAPWLRVPDPEIMRPRVASFFSGIGGFELGFERAGFSTSFFCEKEPFCREILARHWPNVELAQDIKEVSGAEIPRSEVWTGGFPCQDVSLARASTRDGLKGGRSGLFYEFARLVGECKPGVVVIENVPGLLSSHAGRDFGSVVTTLGQLGYGVAWRVLNSKHFGVPQSRQRLYIVGCYRDPVSAGEILFEPECSEGDHKTSHKPKQKALSPFIESSPVTSGGAVVPKLAFCLAATSGRHTGTDWSRTYVAYEKAVRRLTPKECERIQGFPDDWTMPNPATFSDLDKLESKRYYALGNAVSVPVAQWLGQRIRAHYWPK